MLTLAITIIDLNKDDAQCPHCFSLLLQSGQVYFINDGVSVNLFEWLTPLVSEIKTW